MVCAEESPCSHDCTTTLQKISAGEIDAPTTARVVGLPPRGGSTFFRSERKYQRKHAARHYGKKALIAHFAGGARNVARNEVG